MKKFRCTVVDTKEYIVELDESVLTEEYMEDFRKYFYKFFDLQDHAEHLAKFQAKFSDESFIEGYGHVMRDGKLLYSFEKDRQPAKGINIVIVDEDDIDIDVTEIK